MFPSYWKRGEGPHPHTFSFVLTKDPKWPYESKVCIPGALQRQAVLQGAFVKIVDFIKFKGFLVEFLENRRS